MKQPVFKKSSFAIKKIFFDCVKKVTYNFISKKYLASL